MILYYILGALALALLIHFGIKFSKHKSLYPFMPFKYNFRRRRNTFKKTLELLDKRKSKIIVETGTSRKGLEATRGDGAATIVFGKWAKQNDAKMYSVDISEDSVKGSQYAVTEQGLDKNVSVLLQDALVFLAEFDQKIDLLYLDSYDYSRTDVEIQQKSQEHHLKEFQLAEDKLHEQTIVLIDDCGLPGGGKGKLVVEYMIEKGWEVLIDTYQILLIKKGTSV
ncbi:class I SAM-dependent methyltransferase [uncultured Winogradskyella sp.]|uniref:class I SAM-dependent methyltransferase n=1 Tax=uncultured Winogradskyella sp. TaxID=395353 RepID=UPI002611E578|nr:class I SAM-dependent methyltransferase [uncultured Winogradskyella sp.]